jgi:hypothetical protein
MEALAKAVRAEWIAEVSIRITVVLPQRSGGHADLGDGLEVLEVLAPV